MSEVKVIPSRSMCLDGFIAEDFARVLDVGCGEGELARYLPDGAWVGLDNSQTMLEWAPGSRSGSSFKRRGATIRALCRSLGEAWTLVGSGLSRPHRPRFLRPKPKIQGRGCVLRRSLVSSVGRSKGSRSVDVVGELREDAPYLP